jgi:hypothetical protein
MTKTQTPSRERAWTMAWLLALALIPFAGSTGHVVTLANEHGQGGWYAVTIAGVVELLAASAGWEIRLRHRHSPVIPSAFPKAVLVATIAFLMAANLGTAETSWWGMVLAVVPPAAFLAAAGMVETRSNQGRTPKASPRTSIQEVAARLASLPPEPLHSVPVTPGTRTTVKVAVMAELAEQLAGNPRRVYTADERVDLARRHQVATKTVEKWLTEARKLAAA